MLSGWQNKRFHFCFFCSSFPPTPFLPSFLVRPSFLFFFGLIVNLSIKKLFFLQYWFFGWKKEMKQKRRTEVRRVVKKEEVKRGEERWRGKWRRKESEKEDCCNTIFGFLYISTQLPVSTDDKWGAPVAFETLFFLSVLLFFFSVLSRKMFRNFCIMNCVFFFIFWSKRALFSFFSFCFEVVVSSGEQWIQRLWEANKRGSNEEENYLINIV